MRNEHTWKQTTPEGARREIRASKFGGNWRIQSRLRGEEHWTYHDDPSLEDLRDLRDVLFRKYQRRRASYEELTGIEEWIKRKERE